MVLQEQGSASDRGGGWPPGEGQCEVPGGRGQVGGVGRDQAGCEGFFGGWGTVVGGGVGGLRKELWCWF